MSHVIIGPHQICILENCLSPLKDGGKFDSMKEAFHGFQILENEMLPTLANCVRLL
jgi:hypothetical protein